jgi:hypothetical protein
MTNRRSHRSQSLPVANYSPAIARAVEWLGDRYLLAKPMNAALRGECPELTWQRVGAPNSSLTSRSSS